MTAAQGVCVATGRRLDRNAPWSPWSVFTGGRLLCPEAAADKAPAELLEILNDLNAAGCDGDDPRIGVADHEHPEVRPATRCILSDEIEREGRPVRPGDPPLGREPVSCRGRWELAVGLGMGSRPRPISARSADRLAPGLSRVLHARYGTRPEPLMTPTERAERDGEPERRQRRDEADACELARRRHAKYRRQVRLASLGRIAAMLLTAGRPPTDAQVARAAELVREIATVLSLGVEPESEEPESDEPVA